MKQTEFDLNIGAQVLCADGRCGKLAKYAVDTETWQVTHLIVEEGFLLKRSRAFPFTAVDHVAPDEIQLLIVAEEVQEYPEYREEVIEKPAPDQDPSAVAWREGPSYGHSAAPPLPIVRERVRYGVPEEHAVIERGTPIHGLEERVGTLDHFVVQFKGGEITKAVAQQGLLFTTKRAIPVSMIESIGEGGIRVADLGENLTDLPEYVSAAQDEGSDYQAHADTETHAESERHTAGEGQGKDLATRVAMALFDDPRTNAAVIDVVDEQGMITLTGMVDDPETSHFAEQIAREQMGVVSVINLLEVNR